MLESISHIISLRLALSCFDEANSGVAGTFAGHPAQREQRHVPETRVLFRGHRPEAPIW